jgi:AcrR family transcriptional regulator
MVKTQRWHRRKNARSPEILDAALACFAEKGFAATRMDDIAARAGITKGTIYLYFDGKDSVFKALARQSIGTQIASVIAHANVFEGRSADLLRFVIATIGHFASTSDRVVLAKVLLAEVGNFPELAEFWRREIIDQGIALFEIIIRRGVGRGEFRDVAPGHAARLCIAPILLLILWRTIFARYDEEPYDYQGLIDTHLETLLRGLNAQGAQA